MFFAPLHVTLHVVFAWTWCLGCVCGGGRVSVCCRNRFPSAIPRWPRVKFLKQVAQNSGTNCTNSVTAFLQSLPHFSPPSPCCHLRWECSDPLATSSTESSGTTATSPERLHHQHALHLCTSGLGAPPPGVAKHAAQRPRPRERAGHDRARTHSRPVHRPDVVRFYAEAGRRGYHAPPGKQTRVAPNDSDAADVQWGTANEPGVERRRGEKGEWRRRE